MKLLLPISQSNSFGMKGLWYPGSIGKWRDIGDTISLTRDRDREQQGNESPTEYGEGSEIEALSPLRYEVISIHELFLPYMRLTAHRRVWLMFDADKSTKVSYARAARLSRRQGCVLLFISEPIKRASSPLFCRAYAQPVVHDRLLLLSNCTFNHFCT